MNQIQKHNSLPYLFRITYKAIFNYGINKKIRKPKYMSCRLCTILNYMCITYIDSPLQLRWPNTIFAHTFDNAIQPAHKDCKTNMSSMKQSFYLFKTSIICAIFLYYWTQCIDGFCLSLQRYVRKGNDANKQQFLAFLCYWKNPV